MTSNKKNWRSKKEKQNNIKENTKTKVKNSSKNSYIIKGKKIKLN